MKNIVLVDCDVDEKWTFCEVLEKETKERWCVKKCITNNLHGSVFLNLLRFLYYFLFPLFFLVRRRQYGKIISWQQFYGLNIAFWSRLLRLKKLNDLTVMTFIYNKKGGVKGKIYHKYMSYIVKSGYVDRFICFAKEECGYYSNIFGVDESVFIYVPLGHSMVTDVEIADEGYVFSTGRSNRDYDFLVDSFRGTNYKLVIACDTYRNHVSEANVKILNNCHFKDMFKLMSKCHCVIVPLKNLKVSSGQLVVIQAMSLGKPVVCTKSDGIKDYVVDGRTGFLINNEKEQFDIALSKLFTEKYSEMSDNAKKMYVEYFTEEAMFRRIADVF